MTFWIVGLLIVFGHFMVGSGQIVPLSGQFLPVTGHFLTFWITVSPFPGHFGAPSRRGRCFGAFYYHFNILLGSRLILGITSVQTCFRLAKHQTKRSGFICPSLTNITKLFLLLFLLSFYAHYKYLLQ